MPCGDVYEPKLSGKRNHVNSFGTVNGIVAIVKSENVFFEMAITESTIRMEPMADRWTAFGFAMQQLDGHDHLALH